MYQIFTLYKRSILFLQNRKMAAQFTHGNDFEVVSHNRKKKSVKSIVTQSPLFKELNTDIPIIVKSSEVPKGAKSSEVPKGAKSINKELELLQKCREEGRNFHALTVLSEQKNVFRRILGCSTDHDLYQTVRSGSASSTDVSYKTIVNYNCYNKISFILGACQTCTKNENHILLNLLIMYLVNEYGMTKSEVLEAQYGDDKYTMLNAACWNLSKECMIYCIANGANVNFRNQRGEGIHEVLKCGLDHANIASTKHCGRETKSASARMFRQVNQTKYQACKQYLAEREAHLSMMKKMQVVESSNSLKSVENDEEDEIVDEFVKLDIGSCVDEAQDSSCKTLATDHDLKTDSIATDHITFTSTSASASAFEQEEILSASTLATQPRSKASTPPLKMMKNSPGKKPVKSSKNAFLVLDDDDENDEVTDVSDSHSLQLTPVFEAFDLYIDNAEGNKFALECIDKIVEMYSNGENAQSIHNVKDSFKERMNGVLGEKFDKMCLNEDL